MIPTVSLLLLSQVNSIKISEDSSPLDLVKRILDSASEVHLALLRNGEWGEVPTTRLPQPTISTYDTSDEESCTTRRPSHLRLSPTPKRQRSPSGCGTGNASFDKVVDAGRRGKHLLPCPAHIPQRSISAPSSPLNKSTIHLTPHHRNLHCFHSDHSDDDSSDSCAMGSPIRHVVATRPRLHSHSYVNCYFPIKSQNGTVKQPVITEQGMYVISTDWLLGTLIVACCSFNFACLHMPCVGTLEQYRPSAECR